MAEEFSYVGDFVDACESNFREAMRKVCSQREQCLGRMTMSTFPIEDACALTVMESTNCAHAQCPYINHQKRLSKIRNEVLTATAEQFDMEYEEIGINFSSEL